jgi:hypothetical protein
MVGKRKWNGIGCHGIAARSIRKKVVRNCSSRTTLYGTTAPRVPRGRPAKKGGKGGEPGGQGDRTAFTTFTALLPAAAGKIPVAGMAANDAR